MTFKVLSHFHVQVLAQGFPMHFHTPHHERIKKIASQMLRVPSTGRVSRE